MWDNHVPFSPQVMAPLPSPGGGKESLEDLHPLKVTGLGMEDQTSRPPVVWFFLTEKDVNGIQWYLMVFQGWSYSRIFTLLRDVCSYVTSKVD